MWVSINGDTPSSLHGLYGKSQSKIDDLEVPPFQEPPICLLLEQLVVWSLSSFNPQSGWPWWCGEKVEKNRKLGGSKIQKLDNITIFIYFHIGNRVWKLNTPKSTGFIIIFPMKNGYCRGIPSFRQSQFKNRLARWKKNTSYRCWSLLQEHSNLLFFCLGSSRFHWFGSFPMSRWSFVVPINTQDIFHEMVTPT